MKVHPKTTHGLTGHPLYCVWKGLRERCRSPKNRNYFRYGGRGIKVCEEWNTDFKCFVDWSLANGWKPGLQIDRINNDGNYEPGNCRFVDRIVNVNNTRKNRRVLAFGETRTVTMWSRDPRCVVARDTLIKRLNIGWPAEMAITHKLSTKGNGLVKYVADQLETTDARGI